MLISQAAESSRGLQGLLQLPPPPRLRAQSGHRTPPVTGVLLLGRVAPVPSEGELISLMGG